MCLTHITNSKYNIILLESTNRLNIMLCKGKLVITMVLGVVFIILPIISTLLDPVTILVNHNTRVTENSFMFELFQKEVEGAHVSLYIFNVTNADRFMDGKDHKLKVEEVGPFTYAEIRQNVDIDLNEESGELEFTPRMKLRFIPEESVADPEDVNITVPNLALLSATSLLSTYPSWIQQGYNFLVSQQNYHSISSFNVHSYLWGYNDPLIALANKLVPGLIYFDKLGIIDRLYENKTMYRMKVGITDIDRFSIKTLKKYIRETDWAKHSPLECYNFTDTYEGVSYPPGLTLETPLNLFRIGVCRALDLEFQDKIAMDYGAEAWQYKISDRTFTKDCNTNKGVCGMLDLSNCTYGIPIAMSRAHFLDTDPKLYERIEGISPDPKIHDSILLIEPKIGFTLSTTLSLQMNINLGDISFNEATHSFSNMVLPVAYIKVVQQDVFSELDYVLKLIHTTGPNILITIDIILFLIGVILLAYSGVVAYKNKCCDKQTKSAHIPNEKQSAPLIGCHST
uniref:Scavenger receptor class B member 1 n=1 Tax=Antheraea pernyi TaxID=7119 RepID=A0A890C9R5_ANTPE|nr:scavenger receptor class B member 1-like protein [Antheraea pernyi]